MNLDPALISSGDHLFRISIARLLAASMLLCASSSLAQTQSTWLNPIDGNWNDSAPWSTAVYPNNGQPTASDTYDVLINAVGSPYTVRLDNSSPLTTINSLTLDSPDATLHLANSSVDFNSANGIALNQGRMLITGGVLGNTTITGTNGRLEINQNIGARNVVLEDVTLDVDTYVYYTGRLTVVNDLLISTGTKLYLGQVPSGGFGGVISEVQALSSPATISGLGEIVVAGGGTNPTDILLESSVQTLSIASDMNIRTYGGAFTLSATNQGNIHVDNVGDILRVHNRNPGQFQNTGQINVNAEQLWLDGGINTANLGTVNATARAEVHVVGEFDLLGGTLDPAAQYGGQWLLSGGQIKNGRIETPGTAILLNTQRAVRSAGSALENITLAGLIQIENGDELRLLDGIVFDNGRIELGGNGSYGRVIATAGSLHGSGEIVFTGTGTIPAIGVGNQLTLNSSNGSGVATIEPGIVIRTDGNDGKIFHSALSISNSGLISADGQSLQINSQNDVQTFLNPDGVLEAKNDGFLRVLSFTGDSGSLNIDNGGTIRFGGDDDNSRPDFRGGDIRLSENMSLGNNENLLFYGNTDIGSDLTVTSGGRVVFGNTWTNTGTVNLQSGGVLEIDRMPTASGTLNLDGTVVLNALIATPNLLTLPLSNAEVAVSTTGQIDNTSNTLTIGTDVGSLELRGGSIEGGTIASATSEKLTINYTGGSSQLVGVQDIQSEVDLIGGNLVVDASIWTDQINASANTHLFLQGIGWNNTGGVTATDADVTLAGTSANLGSLGLTRSTLHVTNANTSSALQSAVSGVDSDVSIANGGSVDNTSNTIVLDQSTLAWSLAGGTLTGGQVQATSLENFHVAGGNIDGVVFTASVELREPGNVELNNASQLNGGLIFTNQSSSAVANLGTGQTLSGFGDVLFDQGSTSNNRLQTNQPTLDILAGITVRAQNGGQGTLGTASANTINRGTLAAEGTNSYLFATGSSLTNSGGLFSATNNGTLELDSLSGNLGQAIVNTGGTLIINGAFTIDHPITIDTGTLSLDGSWSATANVAVQDSTLIWKTLPTSGKDFFQLSNSTLSIAAPFTSTNLPSSFAGNSNGLNIGSGASLDLLGGSFDADATPLSLNGGTIRNGQINGSSASPIEISSTSIFDGINFSAAANITQGSTLHAINALANSGQITNNGGTLRSDGLFTNSGGATVTGNGNFYFFGQVQNQGDILFNGGNSTVSGVVTNSNGSLVSTTGGNTTTFNDDFINQAGAEVHTSAGSSTIFLDLVQGAGSYSGTGDVIFSRGFRPGSSPGVVQFDGNVELVNSFRNTLAIEIGGTSVGDFDQLDISGDLQLGGRIFVSMIDSFQLAAGQQFIIADADGDTTGTFFFLEQDARVGIYNDVELFINYSAGDGNDVALYTVPEPSSFAALMLGLGVLSYRRRR